LPFRLRGVLAAALVACAASLAACGDDAPSFPGDGDRVAAGGGGTLELAVPGAPPSSYDPLEARTLVEREIAAQLYEPLVQMVAAPFRESDARRGIATGWSHSEDYTVWAFRLRPDVRFEDDSLLDAGVVIANVNRWLASETGSGLLPGLFAADAPRPDRVRLILTGPDRQLPDRLGDPRLGLVAAAALAPGYAGEVPPGTGPFRLVEGIAERVELARNRRWWGSPLGLGPALDRVVFHFIPSGERRAGLLRSGMVRVATGLDPRMAGRLEGDPLITVLSAPGYPSLALERSVRGITSPRPAPLSGAWLTVIGQG
jgi:ABC-type transport system substrate-binding protein